MKILHIITSLDTGGAEMMLLKLVSEMVRYNEVEVTVASLMPPGPVGDRLRAMGVPVYSSEITNSFTAVTGLQRLQRIIRDADPDIVQTWMYHADLLGGIVSRSIGCDRIVWNVRNSTLDVVGSKRSTRLISSICAWISRWVPDRIVTCAERAKEVHGELGYDIDKMVVIPNGFDVERFAPDDQARSKIRSELGIRIHEPLVGMVGRFDPQKDHRMMVAAAYHISERIPNIQFVLAGDGMTWSNSKLSTWIRKAELQSHFHLLGRRDDIPEIFASLDVSILSSAFGEAFPNVIGEAMACGVPCVVTDVGDAAAIVGASGRVVSPNDAGAFATACVDVLSLPIEERAKLGNIARRRIVENYSLSVVAQDYMGLYRLLAREL